MNARLFLLVALLSVNGACLRTSSNRSKAADASSSVEADAPTADETVFDDVTVDAEFSEATVRGEAGGPVRASTFAAVCKGNVTARPSHQLTVSSPMQLTVSARPSSARMADLTLAIRGPDGEWVCVDDADELNPVAELDVVEGLYDVWVGAYGDGLNEKYEMTVRKGAADLGDTAPSGPSPIRTENGSYGGLRLLEDTGYGSLRGTAGGTREASEVAPGCSGFIGMTPDHVLELDTEMPLRIRIESREDTTLLIQGPDGASRCNDDSDGWNPALRETLSAGAWSVYVGTYAPSKYPEYTLHVSR